MTDSLTPAQQAFYDDCRARGESHNMALMLACRQAPGMNKADERLRLAGPNGSYQAGLARYRGDPEAFVTSRADLNRKMQASGVVAADGPTGVKTGDVPAPPPPKRLTGRQKQLLARMRHQHQLKPPREA